MSDNNFYSNEAVKTPLSIYLMGSQSNCILLSYNPKQSK